MRVYGSPRIHADLRLAHDVRVGRNRVERLIREAGIARSMGSKGDCFDNAVAERLAPRIRAVKTRRGPETSGLVPSQSVCVECIMSATRSTPRQTLPRRLHGADQVDVAYEPWRAVTPTVLRLGPNPDAPAVLADDGSVVGLDAGQHLGRQSTRNPGCLDRPPLRPAVAGFVWGYCMPPATRKSGWMRLADLLADPQSERRACGPAGADFDRRDPSSCGGHCDGRPVTAFAQASGEVIVGARDVYLRYAPGSTAFRYLVRGDRVRRLVDGRSDHASWAGAEVRSARWTPAGVRGWLLRSAFAE